MIDREEFLRKHNLTFKENVYTYYLHKFIYLDKIIDYTFITDSINIIHKPKKLTYLLIDLKLSYKTTLSRIKLQDTGKVRICGDNNINDIKNIINTIINIVDLKHTIYDTEIIVDTISYILNINHFINIVNIQSNNRVKILKNDNERLLRYNTFNVISLQTNKILIIGSSMLNIIHMYIDIYVHSILPHVLQLLHKCSSSILFYIPRELIDFIISLTKINKVNYL